jgi:hypothetical protein
MNLKKNNSLLFILLLFASNSMAVKTGESIACR